MSFPVTDEFKEMVKHSHKIATRVEVFDGQAIGEPALVVNTLTEGQVTEDYDQDVRRRANFTVVDGDGSLTPDQYSDILTPYGNEFKVYRGIEFPDGTQELIPQGVFLLTDVEIGDTGPELELRCTGRDRWERFVRAKFIDTTVIPADTLVEDAIMELAMEAYPDVVMNLSPADEFFTPKMTYDVGDDRDVAIKDLGHICGCDVYFDVFGRLTMHPYPDYATAQLGDEAWVVDEGETGTLLYVDRRLTLPDDFANWVVVTGEGTSGNPIRGEAKDEDPGSETSIGGKLGAIVKHVQAREIKTHEQAVAMAQHVLLESLGRQEMTDFLIIPNPAMQVGDLVRINRRVSKLEDALIVLDQVSHPLPPIRGGQGITRRRRLV